MFQNNNKTNYQIVSTSVKKAQTIEQEFVRAAVLNQSFKSDFESNFLVSFINAGVLEKIVTLNPTLTKTELKLLIYFMSIVKNDGSLIINLDMLVANLKTTKPYICKSLNNLVKKNIVLRKGKLFSYQYSLTSNLSNE